MKKKNYVYRLICTGVDYADLKTAVQDAYANIRFNTCEKDRLSSPYVLKVRGGYQVSVFRNDGSVLRRKIDVFEPLAKSDLTNKVKVHNVRANKAGEFPDIPNYFLDDDEDELDALADVFEELIAEEEEEEDE